MSFFCTQLSVEKERGGGFSDFRAAFMSSVAFPSPPVFREIFPIPFFFVS